MPTYLPRFAILAALIAAAGCGPTPPPAGAGPEALYRHHCARCHARAGEPGGPGLGGSKGPDLSRVGAAPGMTADWLADYIRDPKSRRPDARLMPAFGDEMSADEIRSLAEWLAAKK
ncbi:MAG: hypothetical protein C0501_08290 [Isosphaera sp.]|nr:hypothetical protein [Isosphaera sp.]